MSNDTSPPVRPNCYECKHRGTVPGSAHSSCAHPTTAAIRKDPIASLMASLAGDVSVATVEAARALNVNGSPHGIRRGWFHWPYDFDPTWLETCDGFETQDVHAADAGVTDGKG